MPDPSGPVRSARLRFQGLRSRVRRGHVAALSAVAAAAFGLAGLRAIDLPGPRPVLDGERLTIEVVHPVEPDIVPGARMDVGELVDGFQGVPPAPPPLTDAVWTSAEAWIDDLPPPPPPPRWRPATVREEAPVEAAGPPRRDDGRWFGFDGPRRDYQAERAARRARLEAMDRQAREEREARHRDWARAREEAPRRQDWREQERADWREVRGEPPVWRDAPSDKPSAGEGADGGSFTGPQ